MRFSAHGFFVSDRINRMDKMTLENVNGEHSVDSVHSVEKPLPNSKKTYVSGKVHREIRVPFREISLAPTKSINGEIEINEPVRVYDTSGPWGDPDFHGDVTQGLPPLRAKWIRERGDVRNHCGSRDNATGRWVSLTNACRACAAPQWKLQIPRSKLQSNFKPQISNLKLRARRPLRAKSGKSGYAIVLCAPGNHHARNGIHRHSRESGERTRLACRIRRLAECFFNCPQFVRPSACWQRVRCKYPRRNHPRIRPLRSRARPRHHSRKHQSSRIRADDHRP